MAQNIPTNTATRNQRTDRVVMDLNGCPVTPADGCITGTTPTSNATTVTPFVVQGGQLYLLQCDTACYVATGSSSALALAAVTGSSATAGGFLVDPTVYGTGFLLITQPADTAIAMVPVTGTTNLKALRQV